LYIAIALGHQPLKADRYVVVEFTNPTNAAVGGYYGLGRGIIKDFD
jgi:hypothetical protein